MPSINTTMPELGRRGSEKLRTIQAMRGIPNTVPAERVRAHLQTLVDIGIAPNMIARAAGVTHHYPNRILRGDYSTISTRYAARLLKVDHHPHPRQERVLSIGAARRIQALRSIGWDCEALAKHLDIDPSDIPKVSARPFITYEKWLRIRDGYERLSMTRGPSKRATLHAERQKWVLPMEWEGYDIDDPRVKPRKTRRTNSEEFRAKLAERKERVQELTGQGFSAREIADFLGVSYRTVERDRSEFAA